MAGHQALLLGETPAPTPTPAPTRPPLHSWGGSTAARATAALVFLLTTSGFYFLLAMGKGPAASIVFSRALATAPGSGSHRRLLRGGVYPVTSPTNGGNVVARVPWAPFSIAEAQVKIPPNAVRMEQNALVGQKKQDNKLKDDVYTYLRVYARLQRRAENPAIVTSLQDGLVSPTYVRLRQQVQQPNYRYALQAGLYRRADKYQEIQDRVSDPAYLADLQASLYKTAARGGPPPHPILSDAATAVEARPLRPSHVP